MNMHNLKISLITLLLFFNFYIISSDVNSDKKNETFEYSLELIKEILEKYEE
jgi:hypothetical protein